MTLAVMYAFVIMCCAFTGAADGSGGEKTGAVEVVVARQANLLEIVDALGAASRFASALHGGQQQGDQNGDDGDHDEEFDEGETLRIPNGTG